MSSNKLIKILRGGEEFDFSTHSDTVIEDGQPLYITKFKHIFTNSNNEEEIRYTDINQLYVGTGENGILIGDIKPVGAANLKCGDGLNSVVQIYTNSEYDSTHYGNECTGQSSVVLGMMNTCSGANSFVSGLGNSNANNHSIVGGKYNEGIEYALLEIGNGTSDTDRKNAFTVLNDGRAKVQGQAEQDDDVLRWQDKVQLVGSINAIQVITTANSETIQSISETIAGLQITINDLQERLAAVESVATDEEISAIFNEEA